MKKLILLLGLSFAQTVSAFDEFDAFGYAVHSFASPVLDWATTAVGQDAVTVSWKPSEAFGTSATWERGIGYEYYATSRLGNLAALLLPVAHISTSYHLPGWIDNYVVLKDRSTLKSVASFLIRHGSITTTNDNKLQLSLAIKSKPVACKDILRSFAAEMIASNLP